MVKHILIRGQRIRDVLQEKYHRHRDHRADNGGQQKQRGKYGKDKGLLFLGLMFQRKVLVITCCIRHYLFTSEVNRTYNGIISYIEIFPAVSRYI